MTDEYHHYNGPRCGMCGYGLFCRHCSPDSEMLDAVLVKEFDLSPEQANAILDNPKLRSLTEALLESRTRVARAIAKTTEAVDAIKAIGAKAKDG